MFGAKQSAIDQIKLVPGDEHPALVQVEAYMAFGVTRRMDDGNASSKRKNVPIFDGIRDGNALVCLCFSYQFLHLVTKAFWHGLERGFEILGIEPAELLCSFDIRLLGTVAYHLCSFGG